MDNNELDKILKEKLKDKINIYENSKATDFEYINNLFITKVNNYKITSKILMLLPQIPTVKMQILLTLHTFQHFQY